MSLYLFELGDGIKIVAPTLNDAYVAIDATADKMKRKLAELAGKSYVAPGIPVTRVE